MVSDDPFFHHRLAAPVVRGLARLPGKTGAYWSQILDYLEKRQRADMAVTAFDARLEILTPDSICLDLGANVGSYTRRMAEYAGHVHAFEPDPWAFSQLSQNLADLSNVTLHNAAVSDRAGTIRLHRADDFESRPEHASLGSSILSRGGTDEGERVDVVSIALTDFISELDADIALIKMDIEGAEVAVLQALCGSDVLQRIDAIFIETHYHTYPEQIAPMADLKRRYGALSRPMTNFDWP
ncbi:Methyltransferase FkbM (plasmid) [Jannaschia sp. CCS1]|nr:Methyltransferase FkbM [Jannaschia sp. CCS1]